MKVSNWPRVAALAITVTIFPTGFAPVLTSDVFASESGAGHSHSTTPATKDQILDTARKVIPKLIADGKVGATWKEIAPDTAEQKEFGKKKEWVVTFKDPKATDKSKEALYLFFSLTGNFLAANHTRK